MQTILLAKAHDEKKGYILLAGPDVPMHKQVAAREKLIASHPVNDDYSEVLLMKVDADSFVKSPVRFVTTKQDAENKKDAKTAEENLGKQRADEIERGKKIKEAKEATQKAAHTKQVEAMNKQHDAWRETFKGK